MAALSLEERLSALEAEVKQLKQEQEKSSEEPRGWQRFVGAFENMPGFEEGVRLGREWRESEDPSNEEGIC